MRQNRVLCIHDKGHNIFRFTNIAHHSYLGFCVEIDRAENTAYANIQGSFACAWSVSRSVNTENYRAIIAISTACINGDFYNCCLLH